MRDSAVVVPDGRSLAYTEPGDPAGAVAMYFHGSPTGRLDLVSAEDQLKGSGVRVLSRDRPGYGGSSPRPGRAMSDWPADAAALVVLPGQGHVSRIREVPRMCRDLTVGSKGALP